MVGEGEGSREGLTGAGEEVRGGGVAGAFVVVGVGWLGVVGGGLGGEMAGVVVVLVLGWEGVVGGG